MADSVTAAHWLLAAAAAAAASMFVVNDAAGVRTNIAFISLPYTNNETDGNIMLLVLYL